MTQSDAPNEASQWGECYDEAVKILSDGDENYKLRRIADLLLANKKMHVAPNEGEKITEDLIVNTIRPIVKNDDVAMWASEDDLLIYEHFFIKGMEYVYNQEGKGK